MIVFVMMTGLALVWIAIFVSDIAAAQKKQAGAQKRQAKALENISDTLSDMHYDDDKFGPSDMSRMRDALEKLAGIAPPKDETGDGNGTGEPEPTGDDSGKME